MTKTCNARSCRTSRIWGADVIIKTNRYIWHAARTDNYRQLAQKRSISTGEMYSRRRALSTLIVESTDKCRKSPWSVFNRP